MKLLIADDEKDIADAIGIILKYSGFDSDIVYNGTDALEYAQSNVYDGIVLDIMMPGMDGITVLSNLRNNGDTTPVLMLTAKAEVEDRVSGLNMGADDYLAKPFDKNELIARINVMMRRQNTYNSSSVSFGNISLNTETFEMSNGSTALRLSGTEIEMLSFLIHNKNKYATEQLIIEKFWADGEYESGAVTLYISYLKNKLNSINASIEIVKDSEKGYCIREKV